METDKEESYKREILPAMLALKDKAQALGFPCLLLVQVGEQIRMVGDATKAPDNRLNEVALFLLSE